MITWAVAWVYVTLIKEPAVREIPTGLLLVLAIIADAVWMANLPAIIRAFY